MMDRLEKITNDLQNLLQSDMADGYKAAWNAAIEAAALVVQPQPNVEEERSCEDVAIAIRKLKK